MTASFSGEVHPAAELFPLMSDDELAALADDIKENGLRQPIVLDGDGKLLDGRNRLRACEAAGIKPSFVSVNGSDPVAFVVSLNVKRRNLTASQRAIAAAEAGSLTVSKLTRSGRKDLAGTFGIAEGYVSQARALDPDLAAQVKTGSRPLADAYAEQQDRKRAAQMRESSLDVLRASHPDLADLVQDGGLALSEALAAARKREEDHAEERRSRTRDLSSLCSAPPAHHAERFAEMFDPQYDPQGVVTARALRSAAEFASAVADALERSAR